MESSSSNWNNDYKKWVCLGYFRWIFVWTTNPAQPILEQSTLSGTALLYATLKLEVGVETEVVGPPVLQLLKRVIRRWWSVDGPEIRKTHQLIFGSLSPMIYKVFMDASKRWLALGFLNHQLKYIPINITFFAKGMTFFYPIDIVIGTTRDLETWKRWRDDGSRSCGPFQGSIRGSAKRSGFPIITSWWFIYTPEDKRLEPKKPTQLKFGKSSEPSHHFQVPAVHLPGCIYFHRNLSGKTKIFTPFWRFASFSIGLVKNHQLDQFSGAHLLLLSGMVRLSEFSPLDISGICSSNSWCTRTWCLLVKDCLMYPDPKG